MNLLQSKPTLIALFWAGLMCLAPRSIAQFTGQSSPSQFWANNANDISNTNSGAVGIGTATPRSKLHVNGPIESHAGEATTFGSLPTDAMQTNHTYRSFSGSVHLDGAPNQITSYIQYRSTYGGYLNHQNQGFGFWSQGGHPRMFMEVISGNHGSHAAKLPADSPIQDGYLYQQIKGPSGTALTAPIKATKTNSHWLWGIRTALIDQKDRTVLEVNGRLEARDLELNGVVVKSNNNRIGIGTETPTQLLEVKDESRPTQMRLQGTGSRGGLQMGRLGFLQAHIDGVNSHDRVLLGAGIRYDDVNHRYDASSNELYDRSAIEFLNGGHIAFFGQAGDISQDPYLTAAEWQDLEHMRITKDGKVGIGTSTPDAELVVKGTVKSREVVVEADAGADFVFEEGYALMPLEQLADYVQAEKHLPTIAPAAEMVEQGVSMGEFQIQLLQKVEELTLYLIALDQEVKEMQTENEALRQELQTASRASLPLEKQAQQSSPQKPVPCK